MNHGYVAEIHRVEDEQAYPIPAKPNIVFNNNFEVLHSQKSKCAKAPSS